MTGAPGAKSRQEYRGESGAVPGGLVVGLTGGIGCGKSSVADLFAGHGVAVVDTDEISRSLTGPDGAAMPAIRNAFGDSYVAPDGSMERVAMRALVFANAEVRRKLESLLHPMIFEQARRRLESAARAPYAILVVPLLLQAPEFMALIRRVLVVDCAERLQVERVMRRSGLSEEEVRAILASQSSRSDRLKQADDVIENDGGWDALVTQVDALHRRYLQISD